MKAVWIAAGLCLACLGPARAQYKCEGPEGKISFQQTPCARGERQQALDLRPARQTAADSVPAAAAPPAARAPTAQERLLANYERDRRVLERQREIDRLERQIDDRNARMSAELAALRDRKGAARNSLAGAAWEQSLSTEMEAVVAKYKAMNDVDLERLRRLHAELAELQTAAAQR